MSFLKKLGQIIAKVGVIAAGYGELTGQLFPKAQPIIGSVNDTLSHIGAVVIQTEAAAAALKDTTLTGDQKRAMATASVAQAILTSSLVAGKKIADPVKFQAGCEKVTGGVADILNSLDAGDAKEKSPQDI